MRKMTLVGSTNRNYSIYELLHFNFYENFPGSIPNLILPLDTAVSVLWFEVRVNNDDVARCSAAPLSAKCTVFFIILLFLTFKSEKFTE